MDGERSCCIILVLVLVDVLLLVDVVDVEVVDVVDDVEVDAEVKRQTVVGTG